MENTTSMESKPKRLSPVHGQHEARGARFDVQGGWLIPTVYTSGEEEAALLRDRVGLIDISARGKLLLKGALLDTILSACLGGAPAKPGKVIKTESDPIMIAKLTLDECLLLTPPGAEMKVASSLEAEILSQATLASVIDQSSGLVGFSISGPKGTSVIEKVCAIPFNSKEFRSLGVVQTSFAHVRTTIIYGDRGVSPTYELFAGRSYGQYLWEAILDAGREFGMQPVGWQAIEHYSQRQI